LVERGGKARSVHIDRATAAELNRVLAAKADPQSRLMTDEFKSYRRPGRRFASHETVNHSAKEYVRGEVHTNTVEGCSIFKRGMKGVYQHCTVKHLHRYLAEFDFRYSHRVKLGIDDTTRMMLAIRGAEGKRLTYRRTGSASAAATARARRLTRQAQRNAYKVAGIRVYRSIEC
jgi:transposase-like protein